VEASTLTLTLQSTEQKPENSGLLLELQKIIANSNETGTVAISISDATKKGQAGLENLKTPLVASEIEPLSTTVAADIYGNIDTDGSTSLVPGSEIPVEKSSQNLASTRHSIQQQYYDGKIAPDNDQENQSSLEGGQQENTFATKTGATVEGNISTAINQEQPNTFAQPLASAQEAQKAQTAESLKPVTLPSGTVVHQEEVIRQIVERFQISRRDTDTRVNIQLHPAELGELKIDLSVKEGSVRANVIAGSQYAQDIIEKNMVKLRSVLESQGFSVGEITVTCKSDTTGDFNLFERQLFSHNEYTPAPTKNTHPSGELFTLDDSINQESAGQQGVNVKI
jgi:flagellar hook-length control protein FliK